MFAVSWDSLYCRDVICQYQSDLCTRLHKVRNACSASPWEWRLTADKGIRRNPWHTHYSSPDGQLPLQIAMDMNGHHKSFTRASPNGSECQFHEQDSVGTWAKEPQWSSSLLSCRVAGELSGPALSQTQIQYSRLAPKQSVETKPDRCFYMGSSLSEISHLMIYDTYDKGFTALWVFPYFFNPASWCIYIYGTLKACPSSSLRQEEENVVFTSMHPIFWCCIYSAVRSL